MKMKSVTLRAPAVLLWLLLVPLMFTGCVSMKQIAKVVEAAGTKDKAIKTEFSGWNANWKYESTPVHWNPPSTNTSGGVTIVPETTLRVKQNK